VDQKINRANLLKQLTDSILIHYYFSGDLELSPEFVDAFEEISGKVLEDISSTPVNPL
jgi:hypothetical protein